MVQGANPGGQLRAGLCARSPSSLGCKQIPILEETLIFQLILWLHIETREICKVLQDMDALEGGVVENRDGQCWCYTSVPIQNNSDFLRQLLETSPRFQGVFEKPKNHVPAADVTTLNMNRQPDTESVSLYQTGFERE